jgi:hypothetical protein
MTVSTVGGAPSGEPVDITYTYGEPINRLWGIPFLGFVVRALVLIPHFIVLWFYGILVGLTVLVSWVPVLLYGRQAELVTTIIGGYLRWTIRVGSYLLLIAAPYPPFSTTAHSSVNVRIDGNQPINRLWGIPFLGIWVRIILCIPHYIALFFVGIVVAILSYVSWLPVLAMGRQASPVIDIIGGYWRWSTRVGAYVLLLTDRYPPFRLAS